jgi:pyruvate ferredoxin oxidoreductase delta subunit
MLQQPEKHTKKLKSCKVLGPVATIFDSSNTGSWRIERPVVRYEDCTKCGTCARYCPANIIDIHRDKEECVIIDYYYCKGCGICANECPKSCIEMVDERSVK